MSETVNIAFVANKIANDIFSAFFWKVYPKRDSNFSCSNPEKHRTPTDKPKQLHPGDAVFHYIDPYLNKTIYLHTDLKSYGKSSLKISSIRTALNSLAMTVECAETSPDWRKNFSDDNQEPNEVRGLLFVANHDGKAPDDFDERLAKISRHSLAIAKDNILHVLGPSAISSLYSVATDIKLSVANKQISSNYRFFYPDLTLWKRARAEDERNAATIETLLSPYFILKHGKVIGDDGIEIAQKPGSIVYYSRKGETVDEFVYLLDSLSRYQLVNANEQIRIRVFNKDRSNQLKNNFDRAKRRYCDEWGFEEGRESEIMGITIDSINQISPNYSPDEIGWREEE
ncbi:hypothetical protein [Pandoraea communis]|uniref:hypothetical protein n=1 Tax=Pandoraea communis TaxID=2508297 RepID=UPI0025A5ABBD|nr:hypothetical protein [Pandoraea communis]MDM8356046.1 hypothetical protein [Pandoraea communis]